MRALIVYALAGVFFIGGGSVAIGFGYAVFRLFQMYN